MNKDVFSVGNKFGEDRGAALPERKPQYYDHFVDVYDIGAVFEKLFKAVGFTTDREKLGGDVGTDALDVSFFTEHPNELAKLESTSVVLALGERAFFTDKLSGPSSDISMRRVKPTPLHTHKSLIEGGIVEENAYVFETLVHLDVYAYNHKRLLEVVQALETLMLKYKGVIKGYVKDIVYLGQTRTDFLPINDTGKRMFNRRLSYRVITFSTYTLVTEELKAVSGLSLQF